MSPKKIHEVSRMAAYIAELLKDLDIDSKRVRIVDVGAGQGHLTRTLKLYLQTTHILALDSDQWQTKGSQIWEERVARALRVAGSDSPSTPIFHKTVHITPDTLIPAIDGWIRETKEGDDGRPDPVLFIALHACGSLTPDVLRACVNAACRKESRWTLAGAVVVGCCYNLIKPTDFPLSNMLKTLSTPATPFRLPPSAFNLATQIPSQWLMSPRATASVSLSIRKVVWRALLEQELMRKSPFGEAAMESGEEFNASTPLSQIKYSPPAPPSRQHDNFESLPLGTGVGSEAGLGIGTSATMRLLGRLPDSAYTTWDTFLHVAGQKLGVDLSAAATCEHDLLLERRLEVQHVLRCLIGPLVESLIILDRVHWLREELTIKEPEDTDIPTNHRLQEPLQGSTPEKRCNRTRVEAINLFDQATGSGRNVAIIIVPASVSSRC
ncbi:Methyltransferase domain containing protein [Amanita muscaria]